MSDTPPRLRCRPAAERGSVVPTFLVLTLVTVVMGVFFFQTGRATDLGAKAQTGADAASLAAATDIRQQILEWVMSGMHGPFIRNDLRAMRAARGYADRNHTTVTSFRVTTVRYLTYDVHVTTETDEGLEAAGYVSENPETGERSTFTLGSGQTGEQSASARVGTGAGSFLTSGFIVDESGQVSGPGGAAAFPAIDGGGGCAIPSAELISLAEEAGVPPEFATGQSLLSRYSACDGGFGSPNAAVAGLARPMKVSLLKLEHAMQPTPLVLISAYRSIAAQARTCAVVSGPCAAPGTSMHQAGLAVDVNRLSLGAALTAVNADPSVGLCQPLPRTDAVHLSHVTGRECGGNTGAAGGGWIIYGGMANLRTQAKITVRLVE